VFVLTTGVTKAAMRVQNLVAGQKKNNKALRKFVLLFIDISLP